MSADLIAHLQDLSAESGRLTARAMFGGHGLYLDGLLVGVLIEEGVYLKADDETRARFEAAGCAPYVYQGQQQPITMSYWSVPEEALDSADTGRTWLRLAQEAALRKAAKKPPRRAKKAAR